MFDGEGGMKDVTGSKTKERDAHWKSSNNIFELSLSKDEVLQKFCGKMFFVWEGNHMISAW